MVCFNTLRIKHLPKELSEAQKEDFARHFGAINVKVITSKAKAKSIVYAKFESVEVAKNVLHRLHQLTVLNCRLSVEYVENDILQGAPVGKRITDLNDVPDQKFFRNFINSINAFNDSVGFHQPPPSHLKYNYPKANRSTINNIAHALATIPRFYTQVLHLMNKMNLPPPFALPEPPVRVIQPTHHPVLAQKPPEHIVGKRKMSSSESEIESDGESKNSKEIIPLKKKISQKKAVKRPKFMKQPVIQPNITTKSSEKPENVFEKVDVQQPKKIELRVMPQLPPDPPKQETDEKLSVIHKKAEQNSSDQDQTKETTKEKVPDIQKEKVERSKENERLHNPDITTGLVTSIKIDTAQQNVKSMDTVQKRVSQKLAQTVTEKQIDLKPSNQLENAVSSSESPEQNSGKQVEQTTNEPGDPIINKQEHHPEEQKQSQESGIKKTQEEVLERQQQRETSLSLQQVESSQLDESGSPDDEYPCISLEELAANQVTDLSVMPVFKNYNPGEPTNKLYIKNCAKTVAVQDLEYIYNRYREEETDEKPSEFNIRLMQEGRMKGQAFVTLDSVEMASKAVKETNGFILKDKPLVVVFGKAGKKK